MIIPGLEFRLGFGYENNDAYNDSIAGYNTWATGLRSDLESATPAHSAVAALVPVFPESDDISQFNAWLSYQTGGLTLAAEWDIWDIYVIDMWNLMFLLIINSTISLPSLSVILMKTLKLMFQGEEKGTDRFTIGPMFTITDF